MKPTPPSASTLRRYGLTEEDWWALWSAQDGKCAICRRSFTAKRVPHIDHDHLTGEVRGLLCGPDNQELGRRHDDKDWFWGAWTYLETPPATEIFEQPRVHQEVRAREH